MDFVLRGSLNKWFYAGYLILWFQALTIVSIVALIVYLALYTFSLFELHQFFHKISGVPVHDSAGVTKVFFDLEFWFRMYFLLLSMDAQRVNFVRRKSLFVRSRNDLL